MPRFNAFATAVMPKVVRSIVAADKALEDSALPTALGELVNIRASQINGCGACLDMHVKEAAAHFDEEQLAALVARISLINAFNRMNVMLQEKGGSYAPACRADLVEALAARGQS